MKKLIFAAVAITITAISFAQDNTSTKMSNGHNITFGVKAGITSSNIKFSGGGVSISAKSKIGFYGGAFAQIGVSESFAVQPELLYSLLGSKSSDDSEGDDKIDLSYISVPVLGKYTNKNFSIVLGPQISFLLSAKEKFSGSSEDLKDEFKSTEIAGVIGAGYTLSSGLGFDARYQFGLSNISKAESDDFDEGGKIKNDAFMIGLHYRFY